MADAAPAAAPPAPAIRVRPARADDVPVIYDNIAYWAARQRMLIRPMPNLFENLRDFVVAETIREDGEVRFAGNGALHVLWGDIAEIRGLAVAPDAHARGVGRALVRACEEEARATGIPNVFAWTYEVGFFEACGYRLIDKSRDLHPRVWSECLRCPFFEGCDENGVLKVLDGVPTPTNLPEPPAGTVPPNVR